MTEIPKEILIKLIGQNVLYDKEIIGTVVSVKENSYLINITNQKIIKEICESKSNISVGFIIKKIKFNHINIGEL
jgi:hypothetical protein